MQHSRRESSRMDPMKYKTVGRIGCMKEVTCSRLMVNGEYNFSTILHYYVPILEVRTFSSVT